MQNIKMASQNNQYILFDKMNLLNSKISQLQKLIYIYIIILIIIIVLSQIMAETNNCWNCSHYVVYHLQNQHQYASIMCQSCYASWILKQQRLCIFCKSQNRTPLCQNCHQQLQIINEGEKKASDRENQQQKQDKTKSMIIQIESNTMEQSQLSAQTHKKEVQNLIYDKIQIKSPNKIIYILFLNQQKLFLGKADNEESLKVQLQKHYAGSFSNWTTIYKPLLNVQPIILRYQSDFNEQQIFYKLVNKYGIDHVRGGIFSRVKLHKKDLQIIQKTTIRLRGGNISKRRKRIYKNNKKQDLLINLKTKWSIAKNKLISSLINPAKLFFEKPVELLKTFLL